MANSSNDKMQQQQQGSEQSDQPRQHDQRQAPGQGGQQSGGMGGPGGGPLNDIGSAQSGMTGGSGMGGNDRGSRQGGDAPLEDIDLGIDPQAENQGVQQAGEVQQSQQREGMGNHRHSSRGNEQAIDADADMDDLGSHIKGAAHSSADKEGG